MLKFIDAVSFFLGMDLGLLMAICWLIIVEENKR